LVGFGCYGETRFSGCCAFFDWNCVYGFDFFGSLDVYYWGCGGFLVELEDFVWEEEGESLIRSCSNTPYGEQRGNFL